MFNGRERLSIGLETVFLGLSRALFVRGLYWLLPGVTLANAVGVYKAWVLLVEILR